MKWFHNDTQTRINLDSVDAYEKTIYKINDKGDSIPVINFYRTGSSWSLQLKYSGDNANQRRDADFELVENYFLATELK